jgi:hypothetical protein
MPPTDYTRLSNEWATVGAYRAHLATNPSAKLNEWAYSNGFEYTRLIPKNTKVRKLKSVEAQVDYCKYKASSARTKSVVVTPTVVTPTEVKPTKVKPTVVTPTVVKPTVVKPTKVKPTEVKPTEVKPTEVKPTEVKSDDKSKSLNTIVDTNDKKLFDMSEVSYDFNKVITSIINIQSKLKNDLAKARNHIILIEANNYSMNKQLQALKLENQQLQALKLENEQFKMLKPAESSKVDIVCDVCEKVLVDIPYEKHDYEKDGIDYSCLNCWTPDKQKKFYGTDSDDETVDVASDDESDDESASSE